MSLVQRTAPGVENLFMGVPLTSSLAFFDNTDEAATCSSFGMDWIGVLLGIGVALEGNRGGSGA